VIVAVFSDVHANLPALEAFISYTKPHVEMYICLGDVVNYGLWNDECLEAINSLPNIVLLEGNHERLFRGDDSIDNERALVRQFYAHSRSNFTRIDLISDLLTEYRLGTYICTHTIENMRVFPDTEIEIDQNRIIGHSHHAFISSKSGKTIVNCGSIGQNRSQIDLYSYAIVDTVSGVVSLHTQTYNFDRLVREMILRGYPQSCIDYYLAKQKDRLP
jgi:predicted phosphodiesterase